MPIFSDQIIQASKTCPAIGKQTSLHSLTEVGRRGEPQLLTLSLGEPSAANNLLHSSCAAGCSQQQRAWAVLVEAAKHTRTLATQLRCLVEGERVLTARKIWRYGFKTSAAALKGLNLFSVSLWPVNSDKSSSFPPAFSIHCYRVGFQHADRAPLGLYTFCHGWLHFSELFLLPSLNLNKKGSIKKCKGLIFQNQPSPSIFQG